jgi:hypothetical protein
MGKTTPFAVTRHGQTVGYYIPARSTPGEAERLSLQKAGEAVDQMLAEHGITEDELFESFREMREGHRS